MAPAWWSAFETENARHTTSERAPSMSLLTLAVAVFFKVDESTLARPASIPYT
jgi:hypothetical protein